MHLNCDKVDIVLAVKYYILKWMKMCISKLQKYNSISTLIQIVCHVYISRTEYALHLFSRVLFIATHREMVYITELIKIEIVYQYLFPIMKKK